jgi:hypothetical protein
MNQSDLPKWLVLSILFVSIAVLMATHLGAHSPYTYGAAIHGIPPLRQYGMLVNPDARFVLPVTQFFYEPRRIEYKHDYNLKLPMQSFLASIGMGVTHSYLIGTLTINFLISCLLAVAAVNLAGQAGLSRRAMLLAGLTFFSLPLWAHYIGQPMLYTVVISINFLIVLTAIALVRRQAATPASFGILTALLTLNYDWYVFAFALLLYLVVSGTLRTVRDYAVYLGTAIIPLVLWRVAIQRMTSGAVSSEIEDSFVIPVLSSWLRDLAALRVWPLTPFVVTSVGLRIGITQVMALLYWPLIVACAIALFRTRADDGDRRARWLVSLIVVAFAVEQMVSAAYDWENNPRRAIPVVFAFGIAYAVAIHRTMAHRVWRVAWLALFGMTLFFGYADRVVLAPAITYLDSGEATRGLPKEPLAANIRALTPNEIPLLGEDHDVEWAMPGRAVVRDRSMLLTFGASQLALLAMVCGVLLMAARGKLLPRWSAALFAGVWAVSLVTRWL